MREQLGICSAAVSGGRHTPVCLRKATGFPLASAPNPLPCPRAALPPFHLHAFPNASPGFCFAPALSFLCLSREPARKENSLCWPLTCEELLVKPTAHQMAGISCTRSADGWCYLSPLSAPIFAICVVGQGFAPIFANKGKEKLCLLLLKSQLFWGVWVGHLGPFYFWAKHPLPPLSEGSSQCEILLISCDVAVVKHFLFNIFSSLFVVLFPGTNVSGFWWTGLYQTLWARLTNTSTLVQGSWCDCSHLKHPNRLFRK